MVPARAFVFQNASSVPEPGTPGMSGSGILGMAGILRRNRLACTAVTASQTCDR